jgi:hypothetical protein
MWTVRGTLFVVLAGLLASACATTVPEGDLRPSAANQPLGGPPINEPTFGAGNRAWGFDIFSGFKSPKD